MCFVSFDASLLERALRAEEDRYLFNNRQLFNYVRPRDAWQAVRDLRALRRSHLEEDLLHEESADFLPARM